tara:strand:- start:101 stop:433 length:333 start_codon:yes stop_codon:yes gene_type:complete
MNNFIKSKIFLRLLLILLFSNIIFINKNNSYAEKNILLNEIKVKRLKTKEIHIKTSAYLCALKQDNFSIQEIRKNMINIFNSKLSENDNSIMRIIVQKMCPDENMDLLFK